MLHQDTLPFAVSLSLAVVEGCTEAPVFFPSYCKEVMAEGGAEETSVQLLGQGQSRGPEAMLSSLTFPLAQRSTADHLQQLLLLTCPQEEARQSRATHWMVFCPRWPKTLQTPDFPLSGPVGTRWATLPFKTA